MARKRSRRGFQAIPFTAIITLGTATDGTVVQSAVIAFGEDFFVISADAVWTLRDGDAGEGPIDLGWNHGDLSVAEIAEALDAELSDPDDIIARERARRPVRRAGTVIPKVAGEDVQLNNGVKIRTRMKFSVGDGHTLDVYGRNRSGGSLAGGMTVVVDGTVYGRWQR